MGSLETLGWDEGWRAAWDGQAEAGATPGRVIAVHRHAFVVATTEGDRAAELSGRFRHESGREADRPAVGDWVAVRLPAGNGRALVQSVLPRRTRLARKAAGTGTVEQVVAANLDIAFIVAGLDGDYSPRRLERALLLAGDGGAEPVIVLNKADVLPADVLAERVRTTKDVAPGVRVLPVSAATGVGLDELAACLHPGRTAALIGSSGVGKSTLVNRLLGEERQRTSAVRASDARGRHTTTHRELLLLPGGALLIDTPGVRELQLWAAPEAVETTFVDVDALAVQCRFANCAHGDEPGCAVVSAVAGGILAADRLESFRKLQRELRHLALRQDDLGRREEKQRWRSIHKMARKHRPRE